MLALLLTLALAAAASTEGDGAGHWQRGSHVQLTVFANFTYTAAIPGSALQLTGGLVGLRCGRQYQSSHNGGLQPVGAQARKSSTDPRLGPVDEVSQRFTTVATTNGASSRSSCEVIARIRYLHIFDAFTFKLSFPGGASGTLAYPAPKSGETNTSTGLPLPGEWAGDGGGGNEHAGNTGSLEPALPLGSHFPSFVVPPTLDFMATNGDLIAGNFAVDKMSAFAGGLGGGFLTIFDSSAPMDAITGQLPAIALSPLTHHKAVYISQAAEPARGDGPMERTAVPVLTGDRVSVGVSGYIDSIPAAYEQEAVLSGRAGIAAAYISWGQIMQANGGSVKMNLADDEYNRVVHYMMDNGGYYCFCQVAACEAAAKVPMHVTIDQLQAYHQSLKLKVGIYHLDPFWHTHRANGQCDGPWASNWSHSEYHWPKGFRGSNPGVHFQMLYMLLAGSKMPAARWGNESAKGNEYASRYTMEDQDLPDGQLSYWTGCCARTAQVVASESHRFWDEVLGYGVRVNNMHAMVVDTLTTWYLGYASRINDTDTHEKWLDGYLGPSHGIGDGGATKWQIPIRTDQSLPSDQMLSVARNWSALVSARCSYDFQESRAATSQFASTGLFLASLGIRPVVDALRTTSVQIEPACLKPHQKPQGRRYIERDLLMATLTTGPIGIGDMIGGTNLTLLNRALRTDGVILKPGFAAHRLDAFYYGELPPGQQHARAHEWSPSKPSPSSPCYLAEVWSAPTVPSRVNGTARTDRRANSMARLFPLNGQASAVDTAAGGRWWYSLLLSDLSGSNCTLTPAQLSPPALSPSGYVVSEFGSRCADGAVASSCLDEFSAGMPLDIETPTSNTGEASDNRLYHIAPVLRGGWVLLGEQSKYVAVSPQRIMAAAHGSGSHDQGGSDALTDDELLTSLPLDVTTGASESTATLTFTVLGEPGENTEIAVVVPSTTARAAGPRAGPMMGPLGGKVSVVRVKVGPSGQNAVKCSAVNSSCQVVL